MTAPPLLGAPLRRLLFALFFCLLTGGSMHATHACPNPGSVCGGVTWSLPGSPCVPGVCVTLCDSQHHAVCTATTDQNGCYSFCNLNPGSYCVDVPTTCCGQHVCSYSDCVSVCGGQQCPKCFCYQCTNGCVSGMVGWDENHDCLCDTGDPGISGVPVTLTDLCLRTVCTTTTNSAGKYTLSNVCPGIYLAWVPCTFCGQTTQCCVGIACVCCGQCATCNFCYCVPNACVAGKVICQECGCPVNGATVQLTNSCGKVVCTTTTCNGGTYSFCNVCPGSYTVTVTDSPDYQTASSPFTYQFSQSCSSSVTIPTIALTVNAPGFAINPALNGRVEFFRASDFPGFTPTAVPSSYNESALTLKDIYGVAAQGLSSSAFYAYTGPLPYFTSAADVQALNNPSGQWLVDVQQPLVSENAPYNAATFTSFINAVLVYNSSYAPNAFDVRAYFLMPNVLPGAGTAYHYTLTSAYLTVGNGYTYAPANANGQYPATLLDAYLLTLGQSNAQSVPQTYPSFSFAGSSSQSALSVSIAPGVEAQELIEFQENSSDNPDVHVTGTYQDACGSPSPFDITPLVGSVALP